MESVKLDKLIVKKNRIDYYFTVSEKLKKYFTSECHMFVEYDVDITNIPRSILVIPFISNVLPLMWITDSILWVEEIDKSYYNAIPKIKYSYQDMYRQFILKGTIVSAKVISNEYEIKRQALQLFSGGIDAIATCIRIIDKRPILLNIYGWFKEEITYNKVFESDKSNIEKYSVRNNLECNFSRSNFGNCIIASTVNRNYCAKLGDTWWHGFQHGMVFIGIAIPLAYYYGVLNIYIASSYTIGERYSCATDPTVDIQVKYACGGVIHDGFEMTRQDKIKIVVDYQRKLNEPFPIRVCSFNDRNCCNCEKCFRTILGLIAEGADISKFDFHIQGDILIRLQEFLKENVKFFTPIDILTWNKIKERIKLNGNNMVEKKLAIWIMNYDFKSERKKALISYRIKCFFPILKRRIMNLGKRYDISKNKKVSI